MTKLYWDQIEERRYESGLDKGVLYLPDGSAVPWNGLTEISESSDVSVDPVYYDGKLIHNVITLGSFSAKMSAITYPDEFDDLEGAAEYRKGVLIRDQSPEYFGLCYRTLVGTPLQGDNYAYKLHIIYNVVAVPDDKDYASISDDPEIVEFSWDLSAIPESIPGYRPTAQIIIDSKELDPWLLEDVEKLLYGSDDGDAVLLPMSELLDFISEWYRVKITDNGDGTWTATSARDGFIQFLDHTGDLFQIAKINAVYLDPDTYEISDTADRLDAPLIKITDNGDGTWTAETDYENIIKLLPDGRFEIANASLELSGEDIFRITDTANDD